MTEEASHSSFGKMGLGVGRVESGVLRSCNWRLDNMAAPYGGLDAFWQLVEKQVPFDELVTYENASLIEVSNDETLTYFKVLCEKDVEGFLVLFSDVTSLKQAENEQVASEARARALIENSADLFFTLDERFVFNTFNKAFSYFVKHHYQFNVSLGTSIDDFEEGRHFWRPLLERCLAGENVATEVSLSNQIWAVTLNPISDSGAIRGIAAFARDVTDEQNHREELRRAIAESEKAGRLRAQFLAVLGHEIRTPMQAIVGAAEILNKENTVGRYRPLAAALERNAASVLYLLDELLAHDNAKSLSDVELRLAPLSVDDLILSIGESMRNDIIQKGLNFELTIDPSVPREIKGDEARLRQVLLNVIGNAVKFTDVGGISISLSAHTQNTLKISVSDTGPGIEEFLHNRLFERHVRAPGTSHKPGSGLGLYISKTLIDKMGGDIVVTSTAAGTRFDVVVPFENVDGPRHKEALDVALACSLSPSVIHILERTGVVVAANIKDARVLLSEKHVSASLPVASVALLGEQTDQTEFVLPLDLHALVSFVHQAVARDDVPLERVAQKRSALVVDDIVDNLWIAQRRLQAMGFDVETAQGAEEAMAHFHTRAFDLVLLDIEMPARDGLSVAREMREFERRTIREPSVIIGYTAHSTSDAKSQCLSAGMNDHLAKPVPIQRFRETINDWLTRDVLIVEDDRDAQMIYARFLSNRDFIRVHHASNLAEARQHFTRTSSTALVILDSELPDGEGLEFAKQMAGLSLPCIALSGHNDDQLRSEFIKAGCESFLVKPVGSEAFLSHVDRALSQKASSPLVEVEVASETQGEGVRVKTEVEVESDIIDLVEEFVRSRVAAAIQLLNEDNNTELKRFGHQLKGTAGTLGFPSLAKRGGEIETALNEERCDDAKALLTEVLDALHQAYSH